MGNTIRMGQDYMVRVPKFKISDVIPGGSDKTHPAFIVNGKEVDAIYISKYQNVVIDGVAYSWPYQKPYTGIDFDRAVEACARKGAGWHLMTNAEWAAIALWCKAHGTIPHGNTNCGKYYYDASERGFTYDGCRTLTGSGPATWSHDHTEDGIYDLVGNVWEWVNGVRFVNGKLQLIQDPCADMSKNSKAWQNTGYGFRFDDESNPVLTTEKKITHDWDGCTFKRLKSDIEVPEELKALALYPVDSDMGNDYFRVDTEMDETMPIRGGNWHNASDAGVFHFYADNPRTNAYSLIGFRSAFVEL